MIEQNWEPVIFNKKNTKSNKNTKLNNNINDIDNEVNHLPEKISLSNSLLIQKGRLNNKLTQKELAKKINIDVSILKNYEIGKTHPDYNILCKLEKILKIKLNKKKLN